MNVLEILNLTKRYGASTAVDAVTLSLPEGSIYGVLGTNAAGKSTLLRLLATLETPTSGAFSVMGKAVRQDPRAVRRLIGFVPESFIVQRGLTVAEHLDLVAACQNLPQRERRPAVDSMLQLVDLEGQRDSEVERLSRGQRQRLALASSMLHDPRLLLLDEPLAGLDAVGRGEMLEVLKELRSMGKTVLLSTHAVADVEQLCDAVGLLHKGKLLASGSVAEVLGRTAEAPTGRRVTVAVGSGLERARRLLMATPEVQDIEVQGNLLAFTLEGEPAVINLLQRLFEVGVQVRRFSVDEAEMDGGLARTLQGLAA
jgi:ABC-2 type transport system ATP-binding protein